MTLICVRVRVINNNAIRVRVRVRIMVRVRRRVRVRVGVRVRVRVGVRILLEGCSHVIHAVITMTPIRSEKLQLPSRIRIGKRNILGLTDVTDVMGLMGLMELTDLDCRICNERHNCSARSSASCLP